MINFLENIMLRHNSAEMREMLESLGYVPLRWTVSDSTSQILIAKPRKYVSNDGKVIGCGSYWNGGLNTEVDFSMKPGRLDCGDDEAMFADYAERAIRERICFDEDMKNEVPVPDWAK